MKKSEISDDTDEENDYTDMRKVIYGEEPGTKNF